MPFSFAVPAMVQKKYCRYLANRNSGNTLDCSFVMAGIESPLDISLIDAAWRLNWSPLNGNQSTCDLGCRAADRPR